MEQSEETERSRAAESQGASPTQVDGSPGGGVAALPQLRPPQLPLSELSEPWAELSAYAKFHFSNNTADRIYSICYSFRRK